MEFRELQSLKAIMKTGFLWVTWTQEYRKGVY